MKLFHVGQFLTQRLSDVCGNKLYPLVAPVNTQFPFTVYRRVGGQATNRDKDVEDESVIIELKTVAQSYAESINMIDNITQALIGYCGQDIMRIMMVSSSEQFIDDSYVQNITIQIDFED